MKYRLTDETIVVDRRTLYRIEALKDFADVHKGDKGGYVEDEHNLSQSGNCWVYDNACVHDSAEVRNSACVYGSAKVYGSANIQSAADYIYIKGLGSEYRGTTVFRDRNYGVAVKCGCFFGSLDTFEEQVKKTHGDNKFAAEYLKLVELIKIHFEIDESSK